MKPLSKTTHYSSNKPELPYLKAKQEWDNFIGNAYQQANTWQFIAIFTSIISLITLVFLIVNLSFKKDRVFIAEISRGGRIVNISPLKIRYDPSKTQKEYFISQFVKLTRSIPLDPVVAKRNWISAYYFSTSQSSKQLNKYFKQNNPLGLLGKKTTTVDISNTIPITANSFQIDWEETNFDLNTQAETKQYFTGTFTIIIQQPRSQQEILENPLGIHIADFHISLRNIKS
jgi:type IV secretion system protein TrbF